MPISIWASWKRRWPDYDEALELVVDPAERIETRHSRSICLIGAGKLEEGFREYEIRNNERFRAYFHHMIKAPRWQGEDVRGKKLLLVGEQGLGDEIMFANILPDAQARWARPASCRSASIRAWCRCSSAPFRRPKSAPMTTAP